MSGALGYLNVVPTEYSFIHIFRF